METGTTPDVAVPDTTPETKGDVARRMGREALLLTFLWGVFTAGRTLAARKTTGVFGHAHQVWNFERRVHLPSEASLQHWALHWKAGIHFADYYYKYVHFTDLVIVSIWLVIWHKEAFPWFKKVLYVITGGSLIGYFLYPLAPPRMNPSFHIVDTGVLFGQSVYGSDYKNHGLFNQYAAMPSMHVGWSWFFAGTVICLAKSRWRYLVLFHAVFMTYVVVVTGNHYWLDGIVGLAMLGVALVLFRKDAPPWRAAFVNQPLRRPVRAPRTLTLAESPPAA